MRKSKILMVMTAFVLAVVGVLVAVTSVLSAQQQSVTSSLQVTYQANNVSAKVSVNSRKQSTSFAQSETDSATFDPADSEHSGTTIAHLDAGSAEFGTFETESDVSTFQRYVVYRFSFQNKYASTNNGTKMAVTMNYTAPSVENNKNVTLLWKTAKTGPEEPEHNINGNGNAWSTTGLTVATDGTSTNVFTGADKVEQNHTYYLYLYVMIVDVTKPSTFVLGGSSDGTLSFTLNGAA